MSRPNRDQILGYVVQGHEPHGRVMELFCGSDEYGDYGRGGVLLRGDNATLFPTRHQARHAILRTKAYEKRKGCSWDTWALRPVRLVAPSQQPRERA